MWWFQRLDWAMHHAQQRPTSLVQAQQAHADAHQGWQRAAADLAAHSVHSKARMPCGLRLHQKAAARAGGRSARMAVPCPARGSPPPTHTHTFPCSGWAPKHVRQQVVLDASILRLDLQAR